MNRHTDLNQQTEQELSRFLANCPCALCGAPATVHAVFTPDRIHQHLFGAPSGKLRHFFYGLCTDCLARGPAEVIPRVEAAAMADCGRNIWN